MKKKPTSVTNDPHDFGLGEMMQFFANNGAKVVVFDEEGIKEVKPQRKCENPIINKRIPKGYIK